jgi:hypothetical protein
MATERRRLEGIRLTEDAHAGLDRLATRYHTTKNALIEALGLAGLTGDQIDWDAVVTEARRIDRARHSRR